MYDQTHENNNENARKSQEGRRRKTKEEGRRTKKQEEGRRGLWNISMWESGGCLDILGLSFVKPETCLVSLSSNPETCLVSPLPNPETCLVSFLPNPDMLGLSFVKASAWSLFCQTQRRVGLSFVKHGDTLVMGARKTVQLRAHALAHRLRIHLRDNDQTRDEPVNLASPAALAHTGNLNFLISGVVEAPRTAVGKTAERIAEGASPGFGSQGITPARSRA
jgi:hypothetical protein